MRWLLYYPEAVEPPKEHLPTKKELVGIRRATHAAKRSRHRCKHGSVIIKGSRVSVGHNKIKNHPLVCEENTGIHAEHDAARKHPNADGAICIVIRLGWEGDLRLSYPCNKCQERLTNMGVKRVIFSDPDSLTGFSVLEL